MHVNSTFTYTNLFILLFISFLVNDCKLVLVHHMINPCKFIGYQRLDYETIVPGAGDYHFLLERVASLGELWRQSQCNVGKLALNIMRGKVSLYIMLVMKNVSNKKINVMWCTKPINAWFFGYYALIVLLWEVHSSLAIARELCFPKATLWEHSTLKTRH